MLKGFVLGVVVTVVIALGVTYVGVSRGWMPAAADVKPSAMERWAALRSLNASIARESAGLKSPIPPTEANLLAGAKEYEEECLGCHGAADGKPSAVASGLYIPAPQLARHGVEDDEVGETYWKVRHGIRFTGMPAFGHAMSDTEMWQVSLFLKQMDKLPPAVNQLWHQMPSVGAHRE